jgi:23S rRNA pseudouridine1911/1915/1917 synthase
MGNKKKEYAYKRAEDKKKEVKIKSKSKAFAASDAKRESVKNARRNTRQNEARMKAELYDESEEQTTAPTKPKNVEKAYKLLAIQEGISNSQAKMLIDRGLVYVGNKKVMIARGDIDKKTEFIVQKIEAPKIIFENDDLVVVDKPAFINADELERQFKGARLLHRLDRETSGVLMLVKNEEYRERAIKAFKNDEVYKEYTAWVEGVFTEEVIIDKPIITEKRKNKAYSKIARQGGKSAKTEVYPLEVSGKKSKVKCIIHEGRTHQIRTHLRSIDFPIAGDEQYGGKRFRRVMLHAKKVTLLGQTFEAKEPKIFAHFSE